MTPRPANPRMGEEDPRTAMLIARAADAIPVQGPVRRAASVVLGAWAEAQSGRGAEAAPPRPTGWRGAEARAAALGRAARRFVRPTLAGSIALAVAAGGVGASTRPGAPLYGTRLAVEAALLPSPGSASRARAELDYADRRLTEARDALARADDGAAVAALEAFTVDVRSISAEQLPASTLGDVRDRLTRVDAELDALRSGRVGVVVDAALQTATHALRTLRGRDGGRMHRTPLLPPHGASSPFRTD